MDEYIKLVSGDGHEFFVDKRAAIVSKTIKAMLEGGFSEASSQEIKFPDISTPILEKVIQYFQYKYSSSSWSALYEPYELLRAL